MMHYTKDLLLATVITLMTSIGTLCILFDLLLQYD
jgi:hypothetical protein